MNITETLRGALRRITGVSLAAALQTKQRTVPKPSILNTYGPRPDVYPKPSPANLRRFSETPVARKAINTIKDSIAGILEKLGRLEAKMEMLIGSGQPGRMKLAEDRVTQLEKSEIRRSVYDRIVNAAITVAISAAIAMHDRWSFK